MTAEALGSGAQRVAVTATLGVAVFPEHGDSPGGIVASADSALYDAKRNGRNRVGLAGPDVHPKISVAR